MVPEHLYRTSANITKEHAKTFYFCSLFLKKEKRLASYSVYALSRMIDDAFDSLENATRAELAKWSSALTDIYGNIPLTDPVFTAVRHTVKKYDIPIDYFQDLLKGMEMDLVKSEYKDFDELYAYCYRVAGVIGLIMLKIFGYTDEKALICGEKMGIAMQLTNILRDVKEDLSLGRVYLPADELERFGLDRKALLTESVSDNFKLFMRSQIDRARSYYKEGFLGIPLIEDKNSRLIANLMGRIYSGILDSIERADYDVFSKRHHVAFSGKLRITARTLLNTS